MPRRLVSGNVRSFQVTIPLDQWVHETLTVVAAQKRIALPQLLGAYLTALAVRSPEGQRRQLHLDPMDASIVAEDICVH